MSCAVESRRRVCCWQAKYTKELQAYLQATGLKASDLVKPRSRKGRVQGKPSVPAAVHVSQSAVDDISRGGLPHFSQVWASGSQVPADQTITQPVFSTAAALPLTTVYRYATFLNTTISLVLPISTMDV